MSKEKKPYSFTADMAVPIIDTLRSGKYPVNDPDAWEHFLDATCNAERVLAVLEYPAVDIELEMWTAEGSDVLDATEEDYDVSLSYFACIKGKLPSGAVEWASDEYVNKSCDVDFSADDWEAQLEQDMNKAAIAYAKEHGYSLTDLNF